MKKLMLAMAAAIVVLDQVTKAYIVKNFMLHEGRPVIDGFFDITYVLNPGAAFGFLGTLNEAYRKLFFIAVTILAIACVTYLLVKEKEMKLRLFSYTLVLAGAVGNFIDRLFVGKVVDFLLFYYKHWQWPAFNVADIAISTGIGLLLLDYIFIKRSTNENNA
ncbi:signal peptidase II [Seleniivibrio woodruffii]|uniref:Lipoprotein signal peptidase n=1 Tax=Seleniivibrio woodruffii TaxID=1078050 RepID=A0A4R1K933_9BACT|nr:signal peptidase II [Seleniivibrio woodruffii]TCK60520.1 signal peptidase II [Seleniivibrio woodruffii]TVZ36148.1 signal peptidase II [Seleniivibrio woodruffii]